MASIFFFGGAALLGVCLVARAAGGFLSAFEKALWGLVAGWSAATLLAYGLARAAGGLSPWTLYPLAAAMWGAAAAIAFRRLGGLRPPRPPWAARHAGLLLVLLFGAPVLWGLVSTRMLVPGEGGLYSGGVSLYDVNFHAAVASSFAYGDNFPPVYTPFPPEPLLYPFMPDFAAAVLLALGADHHAALTATAFPLLLAVLGLVYALGLRVTRSAPAAALAAALFMLSGGLGFLRAVADWRASGQSLGRFWNDLPHNYASMWERGYHWGNVLTDYLLPQRASLFGVALVLMTLACLAHVWERWSEGGTEAGRGGRGREVPRPLLAAGALAGVLPYFHTHSFVAVCLMAGVLTLLRPRREWFVFWAAAGVLALPRVAQLLPHVSAAGGFFRLRPGWMGRGSGNWPLYWLKNVGVPLALLAPAWLSAPRRWRLFYLAPASLFAFAFFVSLSPNDIDDLKLMYYWHLATCVMVAWWLSRLWSRAWLRPLVVAVVLASVASGALALRREWTSRARVYDREELAAAAFARAHTEPGALFLTAPVFDQPILSLAGRPVVRGLPALLWSHGLDVRPREWDARAVYAGGGEAAEVVRRLGVSYVYVGEAERREYGADEASLARLFPVAYGNPSVRIYDARGAAGGGGRAAWAAALARPYPLDEALGRGDPAALFVEFRRIGFFAHRLYRVSYGRLPRYEEFVADVGELGRGLRVGEEGWEDVLAENRRRLVEGWVRRPEFAAARGGRGDAELVAAVEAAGSREEYNSAFVLAHFFAYFGRDPDDPPDINYGGHSFWLDRLNDDGDYGAIGRAFVESIEYGEKARARFSRGAPR